MLDPLPVYIRSILASRFPWMKFHRSLSFFPICHMPPNPHAVGWQWHCIVDYNGVSEVILRTSIWKANAILSRSKVKRSSFRTWGLELKRNTSESHMNLNALIMLKEIIIWENKCHRYFLNLTKKHNYCLSILYIVLIHSQV